MVDKYCLYCGSQISKYSKSFCSSKCYHKYRKEFGISDETKKKQSKSKLGTHLSTEHKEKIRQHLLGRIVSSETKKKMSNSAKVRKISTEGRRAISRSKTGTNNPNYGKCRTEETKTKISEAQIGKHVSDETRQLLSKTHIGELSSNWRGGISFLPYCHKFNKSFKERVRAFFGYRCIVCGKDELNCNHKHSVHHVDYDKQACCNKQIANFALLCTSCHSKTNFNRDQWSYILHIIIYEIYNNKTYYSSEEFKWLTNIHRLN